MAVTIRTRRASTTVFSEAVAFVEDGEFDATGSSSFVALGTIADLSATAGDTQVVLAWTAAANATSHQPQYRASGSGTWLDFGSALGGAATGVTVTGLVNDTLYEFSVVAGDGVTTTRSNVATATPVAPSALHPNLPDGGVGWDLIGHNDGTVVTDGSGQALGFAGASGWWEPNPPNIVVVSDPTNPTGSGQSLRATWVNSGSGGRAGNMEIASFPNGPYSELYIAYGVVFETPQAPNISTYHKQFYLRVTGQPQWGDGIWVSRNPNGNALVNDGANNQYWASGVVLPHDEPHLMEWIFRSVNATTASMELYVDGQLVLQRNDLVKDEAANGDFTGWHMYNTTSSGMTGDWTMLYQYVTLYGKT